MTGQSTKVKEEQPKENKELLMSLIGVLSNGSGKAGLTAAKTLIDEADDKPLIRQMRHFNEVFRMAIDDSTREISFQDQLNWIKGQFALMYFTGFRNAITYERAVQQEMLKRATDMMKQMEDERLEITETPKGAISTDEAH